MHPQGTLTLTLSANESVKMGLLNFLAGYIGLVKDAGHQDKLQILRFHL